MFFGSKKNKSPKAAPDTVAKPSTQAAPPPITETTAAAAAMPKPTGQVAAKMQELDAKPQPDTETGKQEPTELSAEELHKHAAQAKHLSASFGEIVSVFMRTPEFKGVTLGQLESFVVPAVVTGQFLIAGAQSKLNGMTAPVATVLWAKVSEEVDHRLSKDLDQPIKLEAKDWKSGDIPWLIGIAGDHRMVDGIIRKLQVEAFNNGQIKLRSRGKDGQMTVTTIPAASVQNG